MLLILFGLAGVGKNFVGQLIAKHGSYYFYDGDDLLSKEMQEYIQLKKPFAQTMRDEFTNRMIDKIKALQKTHPNIVFAQALFKEKNRKQLLEAFPQAQLILVSSTPEMITSRLKKRNNWIDEEYAKKLQKEFDSPTLPHKEIKNNKGEIEIIQQLATLF